MCVRCRSMSATILYAFSHASMLVRICSQSAARCFGSSIGSGSPAEDAMYERLAGYRGPKEAYLGSSAQDGLLKV